MDTDPKPQQQWQGLKRFLVGGNIKRTLARVALLIATVVITYRYFLMPFVVSGDSMLPSYLDGDVHIAYRRAYRQSPPQRGDVVLIDIAGGKQFLVKRIVGLPGERFAIKQGVVHIDGQPLEEPYVKSHNRTWNRPEIILRPDEYFFIGDNRSMDMPLHTADTIRIERITGKVIY
ncbi:MAG: signal peptidase I [Verrucomicrobiales bacterium]|nr:signal peptidase I [Verrucomicrobiales bacterium]